MLKLAVIFVNGLEQDAAKAIQLCSKAVLGAYNKQMGIFSKKKDFDVIAVLRCTQNLLGIKYSVGKYGMNYFFLTNDESNPDPMQTVLAVGPEEPEKLNKMSAGLRLF